MSEDDVLLRARARALMQNRTLPGRPPEITWGGPGSGARCAICDLPVSRDELEMEIELARDGAPSARDNYHFHVRCFTAWELESRELAESGSAAAARGHSLPQVSDYDTVPGYGRGESLER